MHPTELTAQVDETGTRVEQRDRSFPPPASRFRLAVQKARSWDELGTLCGRIDVSFQAGDLDREVAEELAGLAAEQARFVPAGMPRKQVVFADELLDPKRRSGPVCPCCGEGEWREEAGRRICGTCHPAPRWRVGREERDAA